jgi:hypothetical protein
MTMTYIDKTPRTRQSRRRIARLTMDPWRLRRFGRSCSIRAISPRC